MEKAITIYGALFFSINTDGVGLRILPSQNPHLFPVLIDGEEMDLFRWEDFFLQVFDYFSFSALPVHVLANKARPTTKRSGYGVSSAGAIQTPTASGVARGSPKGWSGRAQNRLKEWHVIVRLEPSGRGLDAAR